MRIQIQKLSRIVVLLETARMEEVSAVGPLGGARHVLVADGADVVVLLQLLPARLHQLTHFPAQGGSELRYLLWFLHALGSQRIFKVKIELFARSNPTFFSINTVPVCAVPK